MARPAKTPKYQEFNNLSNCFGERQKHGVGLAEYLKSQSRPLNLELGCGKAEVSLGLAAEFPDELFMGVDLKADRMWRAAKNGQAAALSNVAFLQSDIRLLPEQLKEGSVDKIWITFPDPFPRDKQAKHRMTGPKFLDIYRTLLKPGGFLQFKTDDEQLFKWSVEQLVENGWRLIDITFDLYADETRPGAKIQTTYEKRWLNAGKTIFYLKALPPC